MLPAVSKMLASIVYKSTIVKEHNLHPFEKLSLAHVEQDSQVHRDASLYSDFDCAFLITKPSCVAFKALLQDARVNT